MGDFTNIESVLRQAAPLYAESVRDSAISEGLFKTGKLAQSYSATITFRGNKAVIAVSGEDYGVYQDTGVNGLKKSYTKPAQSLYPPGQFKSKVIGGPLPFTVRKSIAENGLRPRPFIQSGIDRVTNNFLIPKAEEAGVEDISDLIIPPSTFIKEK